MNLPEIAMNTTMKQASQKPPKPDNQRASHLEKTADRTHITFRQNSKSSIDLHNDSFEIKEDWEDEFASSQNQSKVDLKSYRSRISLYV